MPLRRPLCPDGRQRDLSPPPYLPVFPCPVGVEGDRNGSKEEEDPDDVIARFPSLIGEHRQAQRDSSQGQRPRCDPIRPANAPAGPQATHEPSEIEQRRNQIAPECQHPRAMEDFRVRRVEPGQELRGDEVQAPRIPALKEPRGERPVVPGRIEPGHPRRQLCLHVEGEMEERENRNGQGDCERRRHGGSLLLAGFFASELVSLAEWSGRKTGRRCAGGTPRVSS